MTTRTAASRSAAPAPAVTVSPRGSAPVGPAVAPPIVHEVLRAPGQPLDGATRAAMSTRFGQDFGHVRLHRDPRASESADAVDADAYTVGGHIVFGHGKYAPGDTRGAGLLAHELTHVVQAPRGAPPRGPIALGQPRAQAERDADAVAVGDLRVLPARRDTSVILRRQPRTTQSGGRSASLDARADAIIRAATGPGAESARAIQVVRSIISTYFSGDAALVSDVVYDESVDGLATRSADSPHATGVITVGKQFLLGTNAQHFARRVVQVDHELEHVRQHRQGMGGAGRASEREYLAFRREATATPPAGTGKLAHQQRVVLIDEALKNYCRLSPQQQSHYARQRDELLTLRTREQTASGFPATPPPACATTSAPGTGAGAPAAPGPTPAPAPPPTPAPAPAPTSAPKSAPAPTPTATSAPPVRQATATARQSALISTADVEQERMKSHFGFDIAASVGSNIAALDTFDPGAPTQALAHPSLRWGGSRAAGDLGGSVGLLAVCRDCNIWHRPDSWAVGHEIQGQLSLGLVSGVPTGFTVVGPSGSIDIFHRQFDSVVGLFDWHALTAQAFANLGFPHGPGADRFGQFGGGLGTGLELHPLGQGRLSVTAALMVIGQESIDLRSHEHAGTGAVMFQLTVTANLINP